MAAVAAVVAATVAVGAAAVEATAVAAVAAAEATAAVEVAVDATNIPLLHSNQPERSGNPDLSGSFGPAQASCEPHDVLTTRCCGV